MAFESDNRISNAGQNAWKKETGLLSVWILGMFTPSPSVTIVVPIKPGPESELGVKVTSYYFGSHPAGSIESEGKPGLSRCDGKYRSKIGINPKRSKGVLGAYDADNQVLTIVQFDQPAGVTDYVNSLWKSRTILYGGDVANSYNDGPPSPGAKPLGPFFEMESSSPRRQSRPRARALSHLPAPRTPHSTYALDRGTRLGPLVLAPRMADPEALSLWPEI